MLLFAATLVTTTMVGADFYGSFLSDIGQRPVTASYRELLLGGLWFSVPALAILLAHEMGHYLACRYYRIRASLPYFIPMSPVVYLPGVGLVTVFVFGTLGAVIRIRQPIRRKREIFDVGIAGPLAGIAVAVPAMLLGLAWSHVVAMPPNFQGITLGDPLIVQWASQWILGTPADGFAINMHPIGFAAWFGFFLTGLNLIPAGQLDGGHVAYGCLGRHARWLTYGSLLVALVLGLTLSPSWMAWLVFIAVLLTLFGWHHPRVDDEDTPLGGVRWTLALLAVLVLVLCFIPIVLQEV